MRNIVRNVPAPFFATRRNLASVVWPSSFISCCSADIPLAVVQITSGTQRPRKVRNVDGLHSDFTNRHADCLTNFFCAIFGFGGLKKAARLAVLEFPRATRSFF